MEELVFLKMQTPILSTSSPEGDREYLILSRKHRGQFYAPPQAPQIFEHLLMGFGFDRYFQIAPYFRDKDAMVNRSPSKFYRSDFEMAFATQEDVFAVAEEVLSSAFTAFSNKKVALKLFPRISYIQVMLEYGTDKLDLHNPFKITDLTHLFVQSDFTPLQGKTVRAITVPSAAT